MANQLYPCVILHFYKPLIKKENLEENTHTENISFRSKTCPIDYEVFVEEQKHTLIKLGCKESFPGLFRRIRLTRWGWVSYFLI